MFSYRKTKQSTPVAQTSDGKIIYAKSAFAEEVKAPVIGDDEIKSLLGGRIATPEMNELIRGLLETRGGAAPASTFDSLETKADLTPMFNTDKSQRDVIYVAAPSGSGKSFFCADMARMYRQQFPERKIYLFSRVQEDAVLDKLVTRVKLDESILEDPFTTEMFKQSLVIFDDTGTLPAPVNKPVAALQSDILETGRHWGVSCIVTSHNLTNYKASRLVLTEANSIVMFPRAGAWAAVQYVSKQYLGLTKQQIAELKTLPTRWVYIHKSSPNYMVWQRGIKAL